jgi:hypothetical protein
MLAIPSQYIMMQGDFLQIDAHREEVSLVYLGSSTPRMGGLPAAPRGGLMPDDQEACPLQAIFHMTSLSAGVRREPYE